MIHIKHIYYLFLFLSLSFFLISSISQRVGSRFGFWTGKKFSLHLSPTLPRQVLSVLTWAPPDFIQLILLTLYFKSNTHILSIMIVASSVN